MRIGKYLKFHFECLKKGRLKGRGLCSTFHHDDIFKLIDPDGGDMLSYWGFNGEQDQFEFNIATKSERYERTYSYTEFRQTIVLLMAAINNEL